MTRTNGDGGTYCQGSSPRAYAHPHSISYSTVFRALLTLDTRATRARRYRRIRRRTSTRIRWRRARLIRAGPRPPTGQDRGPAGLRASRRVARG